MWPVFCFTGCTELLVWMREQLGASARTAPVRKAPDAPRTPELDAPKPDADAPEDELRDRRERKTRQPVADLLKTAEDAFRGGMNTVKAKAASLRDIQEAPSIGQGKAQTMQAHFRALQAATG